MKKIKSELINEIINKNLTESDEEFVPSKFQKYSDQITRESFEISNQKQSDYYKKDLGTYELLGIPNPLELSKVQIKKITSIFADILKSLVGTVSKKDRVLVVGLGNRHISADSLGTKVIKNINITLGDFGYPKVMAICPSVLGLTGIETYDIIKGVIEKTNPSHIIFIDSLCASSVSRLACSIQLSNTGICPGSGIGNNRKCLDKTLAKKVYSIGVPLLIYANTFVDTNFENFGIDIPRINNIMQTAKKSENNSKFTDLLMDLKNCLNSSMENIIVSIKDIDECVEILSKIIANAINQTLGVAELN